MTGDDGTDCVTTIRDDGVTVRTIKTKNDKQNTNEMKPCVYFMTNKNNTVIYIGVTSNLEKRIYQHKTKIFGGFTAKYNCDKLVYFEEYQSMTDAIRREKQLKAGNRANKELLIKSLNPEWEDLARDWILFNV